MNREETKECIVVMQAWIDGEDIESLSTEVGSEWTHITSFNPSWGWNIQKYRIKPSPREWWVKIDSTGEGANNLHRKNDDCEKFGCIHVREVLDEEMSDLSS